jgi:hypothetical protein
MLPWCFPFSPIFHFLYSNSKLNRKRYPNSKYLIIIVNKKTNQITKMNDSATKADLDLDSFVVGNYTVWCCFTSQLLFIKSDKSIYFFYKITANNINYTIVIEWFLTFTTSCCNIRKCVSLTFTNLCFFIQVKKIIVMINRFFRHAK